MAAGGLFSGAIADHFRNPRNVGIAARHNRCYLEQDNPWLIRLLFTLRVKGDRIAEVKFQSESCVTTTACASALTEIARNRSAIEAVEITPAALSAALGGIPPEKMHCCNLVVETMRNALQRGACDCRISRQSPTNASRKDRRP